jgi:hypothetical protein
MSVCLPTDDQNTCSCKKSLDTYKKSIEEWNRQTTEYSNLQSSRQRYVAEYNDWLYDRGNYKMQDTVLKRLQNSVSSGDAISQYNTYKARYEPISDPQTNITWKNVALPSPPAAPPATNIVCCSQIFSGIDLTNSSLVNNAIQQCSIKVDSGTVDNTSKTTGTSTFPMWAIWAIVGVIVFILLICSLILVLR